MKIICNYEEKEELMNVIAAGCSWIGTKKNNCVQLKIALSLLMEKNIQWELKNED